MKRNKKEKNPVQKNEIKRTGRLIMQLFTYILMILCASVVIMGLVTYLLDLTGVVNLFGKLGPLGGIILMSLASILISCIIGFFVIYRFLKPIRELSTAINTIAKGNFNVKVPTIPTDNKDNEINNLILNVNEMAERLSKIETLRSDFVANVSHEFKTPISTIEGYVTLLQDESLTCEEKQKYFDIICASTRKLSTLLTNILNISKLEKSSVEVHKTKFNVAEEIRTIIIELEPSWSKKNIEFDLTMPECLIESDEELLYHVWRNIISNAIKFSPENGVLSITIGVDKMVNVSITDQGVGMTKETMEHIFDKFYQGDKSHSSEGNGLGLPLVKNILEILNGDVTVSSEVNKGSTFVVSLPKLSENE